VNALRRAAKRDEGGGKVKKAVEHAKDEVEDAVDRVTKMLRDEK
jgi:uncharacterized protein YjbJ (UPF0337 family)